jgi:hypothetical protein
MPDLTREFFEHPQGSLGTVYTRGWHLNGDVLLLGDAAHAIVPFHGQGMNCAFEDLRGAHAAHGRAPFVARPVRGLRTRAPPNTDAIAQMALENYIEMRETVLGSGVPEEEEGSGSVGEEGSELHSAVLEGDVSPGDFILVCARGLATRSRLITAPRLDSSPAFSTRFIPAISVFNFRGGRRGFVLPLHGSPRNAQAQCAGLVAAHRRHVPDVVDFFEVLGVQHRQTQRLAAPGDPAHRPAAFARVRRKSTRSVVAYSICSSRHFRSGRLKIFRRYAVP